VIIKSGEPSGNLNISDDAIWPTSMPSAAAASAAVRALSDKTFISPAHPCSKSAAITRFTAAFSSTPSMATKYLL
jgi:hypothetical protein